MRLELCGKPVMRCIGFGHDKKTGGILVNPVNNAGSLHTADTRQIIAAMCQQSVDQRSGRGAGCGMYDHANWFVDHDQVCIFENHIQSDRLRQNMAVLRLFDGDYDLHAALRPRFGVQNDSTVQRNGPIGDQAAQTRAR